MPRSCIRPVSLMRIAAAQRPRPTLLTRKVANVSFPTSCGGATAQCCSGVAPSRKSAHVSCNTSSGKQHLLTCVARVHLA